MSKGPEVVKDMKKLKKANIARVQRWKRIYPRKVRPQYLPKSYSITAISDEQWVH